MGWRWGWSGPYPGRGPWSHLPPPLRPGWIFGRGWCWWYYLWPWYYRRYIGPYAWIPAWHPWFIYGAWYTPYIPYPWWWI